MCERPECGACHPWRRVSGEQTTLERLVTIARTMRERGWWPHQVVRDLDRVEHGAAPGVPLPSELARRATRLAEEAAADEPRRLRVLSPEEVEAGGVDPFPGVDEDALVTPQPTPPYTRTSVADRRALYEAIAAQLAAGVLEMGEVVSLGRLFRGPKDRPLLDPRWVNDLIPTSERTVRYGRVEDLLEGNAQHGVKADLKAAFCTVPVATARRPFLGICVDGVVLRYARLPFGLATSPRRFVELLQRSLDSVPRMPAAAVSVYVDDIAVTATEPNVAAQQMIQILEALRRDGWRVAVGKTFLRPTPRIIFLGWAIDLPTRAAALTEAKRDKAKLWAEWAPRNPQVLQKLLGLASWARRALRASGFLVPILWKVVGGAPWSDEAEVNLGALMRMIEAAAVPVPLDAPTRLLPIVTDASDGAWAYALLADGRVTHMGRGRLPERARQWSSTAREALAVVGAIQELDALGTDMRHVLISVSTDSASLAHILKNGRTRSPEVARALEEIVKRAAEGLTVTAHWVRRSEGLQPLVDSATAEVRCWHPPRDLRAFVSRYFGPFDVHLGAGERRHSMADRFTSSDPGGMRSAAQAQIEANWTGWLGRDSCAKVEGRRVVAHPEWGKEPECLRSMRAAGAIVMMLRASKAAPTLLDVERAAFRTVVAVRPPEALRRWVASEFGQQEAAAGIIHVSDLWVVAWTRTLPTSAQAAAEGDLRAALAQALHPGPRLESTVSGSADVAFFAEVARKRRAVVHRADQERPREESTGLPQTLSDWLTAVRDDQVVLGTALSKEAERYAAEVTASLSSSRRRARGRQPRAAGAAGRMLRLAEALGTEKATATPEAWDTLAFIYVASRLPGRVPSPVDWGPHVQPATVRDELSAVAEALRTRGATVPPYLGTRASRYLKARGAFQRVEASNALPLSLAWLLTVEPREDAPEHPIWASRVLQSGFVLRPGMAGLVRKGNLVAWGPGFVLTWVVRDKTRRGDEERPDAPLSQWRVSACGHVKVAAVIRGYHAAAAHDRDLIFPTATPRAVMEWLRSVRTVSPTEVQRLTAHGFRTAADTELLELGAPAEWINALGHWARATVEGRASVTYYGSLDLGKLMMLTARMGEVDLHHPAPGVHVTLASPGPVDWDAAWEAYRKELPKDPPQIREAVAALLVEESDKEGDVGIGQAPAGAGCQR